MEYKVVVLIPAYEPSTSMLELLKEIKNNNLEVVIVNDGSSNKYDNIFDESSKYGTVLKHDINQGKGKALKTGLAHINKTIKDKYIVVTVDCDGQHKISDALNLCNYIKENSKHLAIGKRIRNKKVPLRSMLGNTITRSIYYLSTGLDIYDTQTGLRAFSNELVPLMLSINGDRFEYEMNVLLECPFNNIKVKEIKIETIYINKNSHSHFKTIRDSFLIYKNIFKYKKCLLRNIILDYIIFLILFLTTNKLVLSNIISGILVGIIANENNKIKNIRLIFLITTISTILLNITYINLINNIYLAKLFIQIILFIVILSVRKIIRS